MLFPPLHVGSHLIFMPDNRDKEEDKAALSRLLFFTLYSDPCWAKFPLPMQWLCLFYKYVTEEWNVLWLGLMRCWAASADVSVFWFLCVCVCVCCARTCPQYLRYPRGTQPPSWQRILGLWGDCRTGRWHILCHWHWLSPGGWGSHSACLRLREEEGQGVKDGGKWREKSPD